jgi:hypothetical protein
MIGKALSALALVMIGLIAAPLACGASPRIEGITPIGVQRGALSDIAINGANLGPNPRLIAPFGFRVEPPKPDGKEDSSNWRPKLTVASDAPLGAYPIRVQTDDGISNPLLFVVGQLPRVEEKEANNTVDTAQALPEPPLVVEGQVAGNDVDFFRFRGRKGQAIVVDAQCNRIGSGIDPTIRLTTLSPDRRFIASADDSPGLGTDARLFTVLPEDTDYIVELSDSRYQGGQRPIYRLLIGPVPAAEEIYPLGGRVGEAVGFELRGGTLSELKITGVNINALPGFDLAFPRITGAMLGLSAPRPAGLDVESLAPLMSSPYVEIREPADPSAPAVKAVAPVVFNGRLEMPGDEDRFIVVATPGQRLRITMQASELGSAIDGVLRILGNNGSVIANADDTNVPQAPKNGQQSPPLVVPDPSLEMTVPGGTTEIIVAVKDLENRGGLGFPYRLVVEPQTPDFAVATNDSELSIPRGGTAIVGASINRTGFSGAIDLTVVDPPAGLTVRPGSIAAGQTAGFLSVSAAVDAKFAPASIRIVGRGQGSNGVVERMSAKSLVFSQQAGTPTYAIDQEGVVAAPALSGPVVLDTPSQPIEVPHGYSATIPVKVVRTKGADGAITISPLPLPNGLAIANATIPEKALEGKVTVTAATAAQLGTMSIGLEGKGKFGGDRTIALPVVTLSVVAPANLQLASPGLELKPGTTAELRGKIVRKGSFDAPVTVKINGLPAGLKADPVTVAPTATEFAIKVVADAKAPAASAGTQVALAFQVEKKDYPVPPAPLTVKVLASK